MPPLFGRRDRDRPSIRALAGRAKKATDPVEGAALYTRAGEVALELGKERRAMALFRQALERAPLYDPASARLEGVLQARGEIGEVYEERLRWLRALTSARRDARTVASAHVRAAQCAEQLGRPAEAAASYAKAFELDPSLLPAAEAARRLAAGAGSWQQAVDLLSQEILVAADRRERADLLRQQALLKRDRLDDVEGAVEVLQRAAKSDRGSVAVRRELVTSLLRRAERRQDQDWAARDRHEAADVLCGLAELLPRDERLACVESALDAAPDHLQGLELLEGLAPDDTERLLYRWTRHVEAFPDGPLSEELRLRIGRAHLRAGRSDEAIPWFAELARAGDVESALLLVELHISAGRIAEAREWGDRATGSIPKHDSPPIVRRVFTALRAKDPAGAYERARVVLAEDPSDADALEFCIAYCSHESDWEGLEGLLSEVAGRSELPNSRRCDLLARLARLQEARRDDLRAALSTWGELQQAADGDRARRALAERVRLAERLEEWDQLAELLEETAAGAREAEDRLAILRRLAELLNELGRAEEAFDAWARVLELDDGDDHAFERLVALAIETGRHERALTLLGERAEDAAPDDAVRLRRRFAAVASEHLGDFDRAADSLMVALELAPTDRAVAEELCATLQRARRFGEQSVVLRSLVGSSPDPATRRETQARLAHVLADDLRDPQEALRVWNQIVDETEEADVLRALAADGRREGDAARLEAILAKLGPLEKDAERRAELALERAELLAEKLGRVRLAIRVLVESTVADGRTHLPTLSLLESLCEDIGDAQALGRALELQVPLVPASTQHLLLRRLADLYEAKFHDSASAVLALTRWEEVRPDEIEPRLRLVPHLAAAQSWDSLLQRLDSLIAIAPTESEKWVGTVLDAVDDVRPTLDATLASFFRDVARRAQSPERRLALLRRAAELFDEVGKPGPAFAAAAQALNLGGPEEGLLSLADRIAPAAGSSAELDAIYDRFTRPGQPVQVRKPMVLRHAQLLAEAERHSDALDRLLRVSGMDPTDSDLLDAMERAAPRCRRLPDLLSAYEDRIALVGPGERAVGLMLRAVRACYANSRGYDVLRFFARAVELADGDAALLAKVESTAHEFDRHALEQTMTVYEAAARKTSGERAAEYLVRAARMMRAAEPDAHEAAFDLLKRALDVLPTSEWVLDELEAAAIASSRLDRVDRHLQTMISETMSDEVAAALLRRRARLLHTQLGKPSEAADVYRRLWALRPADPDVFRHLRACLVETGRVHDLISATERELGRRTDPGQRLQLMRDVAELWEEARNPWEAQDAWKRVLASAPDDARAREAIERLGRARSGPSEATGE